MLKSRLKYALILTSSSTINCFAEAPKPNIIFVFADQLRNQAMAYNHEDPTLTPNIDSFAQQGVVFKNAISSCPVSTPFRAMLLTGKYPIRTGMTQNCAPETVGLFLRPDATSMGNVFKANGYQTGYIGKWHLDDPATAKTLLSYDPDNGRGWDTFTPPGEKRQGFDYWLAYNAYDEHLNPHYWSNSTTLINPNTYSPLYEADKAIEFISNRNVNQPFLLVVSMNPPHPPYGYVPFQYKDFYLNKTYQELLNRPNVSFAGDGASSKTSVNDYFAAITGVDEQFGKIVSYLKQNNLFDNTIIVFTADHGDMMGSQGRMNKSIWYEESINIPLVVSYPNVVSPGISNTLVSPVDFLPTLLSLSGNVVPTDYDGRDLSTSLINTSIIEQDTVFMASYRGNPFTDNNDNWMRLGWRGVRTKTHTFVITREGVNQTCLLYDLVKDKFQMNPISSVRPTDRNEFKPYYDYLKRKLAEMNDFFLEPIPADTSVESLLLNPGFELNGDFLFSSPFANWSGWNHARVTSSASAPAPSGNYYAKFNTTGEISQMVDIQPNTYYSLSADIKYLPDSSGQVVISSLYVKSPQNAVITSIPLLSTETWKTFSGNFNTGSNNSVKVMLGRYATSSTGKIFMDNFVLKELPTSLETTNSQNDLNIKIKNNVLEFEINNSIDSRVEIYNFFGQTIYNSRFCYSNQKPTIDVAKFDKGIYILAVTANTERKVAKFIKK